MPRPGTHLAGERGGSDDIGRTCRGDLMRWLGLGLLWDQAIDTAVKSSDSSKRKGCTKS